ncbi:hypothetical protein, partial [Belnapia arida]|uniref:hypothetical protein n=1 Tax=Belnapia arida TaxID=2804533 RepID=UPI001F1B0D15
PGEPAWRRMAAPEPISTMRSPSPCRLAAHHMPDRRRDGPDQQHHSVLPAPLKRSNAMHDA